jgi:ABC-type nitrate/sulfonate/bicarbonate transport system substrate-binding protein
MSHLELNIVDAGGPHELVTIELMRAQGYLERMGVTVNRTLVYNGNDAARLLVDGKVDASMQIGFGPTLAAIVGGAPIRVIAGANLLTVHAVYSNKADIRRLKDLEGRVVGIGARGALVHQLMFAALTKQGVDPAKVNFVTIGNSATIFKALLRGEVDAGFGETDVYEHQAQYGVHVLEDAVLWEQLPEFPNQASTATQAALRDKREALVRTLAAHALLYRFLQSPDSWEAYAAASAIGLPGSDPQEARTQWNFYQRTRPFAVDLQLPPAQLKYMQELNVAMGLQPQVLPQDAIMDTSLAREALALIDG